MITIDLTEEIQTLWSDHIAIGCFQERFFEEFGFMPRSNGSGTVAQGGMVMEYFTDKDVNEDALRTFVLNPENYLPFPGTKIQLVIKRGRVEDALHIAFPQHDIHYVQSGNVQQVYFDPPLTEEEKAIALSQAWGHDITVE